MRGSFLCLLLLALLAPPPAIAAEGIFQGKVVDPPVGEAAPPGWIFVQGRNHLLRRVEVAHAVIVFGQQIPASQRHKCGPECLEPGQEIQVTADQDSRGEWRARRVEILRLASHRTRAPAVARCTGSGILLGRPGLTELNRPAGVAG